MTRVLVLIITCFVSVHSLAKDLNLLPNFSSDNPLSYQFIRSITQDQQGFMWFGTQEGLHRYDGYSFTSYHHLSNDDNSIGADVISRVIVDKQGRLWAATRGGGLNLFNASKKSFLRFKQNSKQSITHNNVNALFEDSQGKIWAGTEDGISIISGSEQKWFIKNINFDKTTKHGIQHKVIHAIMQVSNNEIWVGTLGGGVSAFNLSGEFVKQVELSQGETPLKLINTLYRDKDGNVWVGTVDKGLHKVNLSSGDISHYTFDSANDSSISSNTIEAIIQSSDGQIWIASDKGLMIYNHALDNFWRFHHEASNPYSLKNDFVLTLFEDQEQLMWIGTLSGVNRWDPKQTTFTQFNAQKYPELKNSTVTDFSVLDEDKMLFSTYSGGIYQLSKTKDDVVVFDLPQSLRDLRIMSILYEKQHLWIGTRSSGLYYLDLRTAKVKHYQHHVNDDNSISANSITDIVLSNSGEIWVATFHNGINKLNKDGSFERYTKNETTPQFGPSSNHVMRIVEDNEGFFWLGTYGGGVNRFSPKSGRFVHLRHDEKDVQSISSDQAWLVFKDSEENIWVGTQAAGLNLLPTKSRLNENFEFVRFNVIDGMKSRTVYGIAEDKQTGIWISTNKGISRYDNKEKVFKHFGLSHGLTELEYNHGAYFTDNNNTLYFGSANGVTRVDPDKINKDHSAPQIRLIGISRLNQPVEFDRALADVSEVEFDYSDQLISFEFVGLNYSDPTSTEYKYMLEGFDKEWINAGYSHKANYTNLPSGRYRLIVKAKNSDNIWSVPTNLVDVKIAPAPWNTWWAYTFYAALIASTMLMYSRHVNQKLQVEQKRQKELAKQVEEKTREFVEKNEQLEVANSQLEQLAIKDKLTNVKSRRYLDIYIEQASLLLLQIHNNLMPVHRGLLPRLYVVMVDLSSTNGIKPHQLLDCVELLKYTRNKDDVVVRLSEQTFALIGSENENKVAELSERISRRATEIDTNLSVKVAYGFFPFDIEEPEVLEWDKVNVILEHVLKLLHNQHTYSWVGVLGYKSQAPSVIKVLKSTSLEQLDGELQLVKPSSLTLD